jgi:uncharacterized RDD family membrane protein YckC
MKCPKCGYLGFESSDRCRNCGYEFSLAASPPSPLDFPLDPELEPFRPRLDLERIIGAPEPAAPVDLPLFTSAQTDLYGRQTDFDRAAGQARSAPEMHRMGRPASGDEDTPLITMPGQPRAPLGVRRSTPEIPRARPRVAKTPVSQTDNLFERLTNGMARAGTTVAPAEPLAAPARRILAGIVDVSLLSSLDAIVLYFTLRLCGLTTAQIFELPLLPLVAFFALLNGGYFVAFTAVGGQSIGKMAAGIKVIAEGDGAVPIGRATLRTVAYLISALPLGAGFFAGVLGAERLALHDRLTHTRVVRPSQT